MGRFLGLEWRLRSPEQRLSVEDFHRAASRRVPRAVWSYIDEGADDLVTVRANRAAFARWSLSPRMLTGAGLPDLTTEIAGVTLDLPVLLGPTGLTGLSRWDGDLAAARAASGGGTRYVLSTSSSWSIEEVAAASPAGHFFQLYAGSRELSADLMSRAWDSGMRVLFLTVDLPVRGNREGEQRHGFAMPPVLAPSNLLDFARHPRWLFDTLVHQRVATINVATRARIGSAMESLSKVERAFMTLTPQGLDWKELAWIRDFWKGPLYVKGILRADDAARAIGMGANGVVVSNHGGRQLGVAPASFDVLAEIAAEVGGQGDVLLDGGIRRGSDVVKAIALGAKAVLIARPYLYGLIVDGESGVTRVIDILRDEIARALALMGVERLSDLDASLLVPAREAGAVEEHARSREARRWFTRQPSAG